MGEMAGRLQSFQDAGCSRSSDVRRRIALFIGLLALSGALALVSACSAVGPEDAQAAEFTGEPRLSFEKETVYLGEATPDERIQYDFIFRNVGNAPLEIAGVSTKALEGC